MARINGLDPSDEYRLPGLTISRNMKQRALQTVDHLCDIIHSIRDLTMAIYLLLELTDLR